MMNGTVARSLSHISAILPPRSDMSVNAHVSCSIENGSVV